MQTQKVLINNKRTKFYCWGWDQWFSVRKLGWKCFVEKCLYMYEPRLPHLRKDQMQAVAAGRGS